MSAKAALAALLVSTALALSAGRARAEAAPAWVLEAARRPFAPSPADYGAVVLEQDDRVTLVSASRWSMRSRRAIRIDRKEGNRFAVASVTYGTVSGRVKQFRAWTVSPAGEARALPDRDVIDHALGGIELYDEVRARSIVGGELSAGMVFAWESTVEEDLPIAQFENSFQDHELPVALARFSIELPPGWTVLPVWANTPGTAAATSSGTWTWELRDLPEISEESHRPVTRSLTPRLMVTAMPPPGVAVATASFADWSGVADWLSRLIPGNDERGEQALRDQARRLVADARSEMDTLRALARYVQRLRYVSIQMGYANGGGYRPRPAPRVLERGYGDCKDKANLMRELLAAVGRDSWLVSVRGGEPFEVEEKWPSPSPFNHCILAIRLRSSHGLSAELAHPRLGWLLIFDATDAHTPLGDLAPFTQGGVALVESPGTDPLVRLPLAPAGSSAIERKLEMTLAETGDASGDLFERCRGAAARIEKAQLAKLDAREYRGQVVGWLRRTMPSVEVDGLELREDSLVSRFETAVRFRTAGAAQSLHRRILVLRPPVFSRGGIALTADRPRRHPVVLDGRAVSETLVVKIPEGWTVDEVPDGVSLAGPLATFETRTTHGEGRVVQTRTLLEQRGTLPAERFSEIQAFYRKVRAAEDAPIVFARP